jgi:putative Mg2+ transporter-C (MgtC) family protein
VDLQTLIGIEPLDWLGILCACASGAVIGLERQLLGKPVGIRTSALITLGTYVFVVVGSTHMSGVGDPSRVIGQVITGIGFLGAGVILSRDGVVLGVTSAAAIWMLAAIGVLIGNGNYFQGVKMALLTVAILVGVDLLEDSFRALQRGVHRKLSDRNGRNSAPPSIGDD